MITTLLHLLRLFPFLCGGHRQLALENLALRQQLAVFKRTVNRPGTASRARGSVKCSRPPRALSRIRSRNGSSVQFGASAWTMFSFSASGTCAAS